MKYLLLINTIDSPVIEQNNDTLIAGEVIEHLKKPEHFIKEANRVLKKTLL